MFLSFLFVKAQLGFNCRSRRRVHCGYTNNYNGTATGVKTIKLPKPTVWDNTTEFCKLWIPVNECENDAVKVKQVSIIMRNQRKLQVTSLINANRRSVDLVF